MILAILSNNCSIANKFKSEILSKSLFLQLRGFFGNFRRRKFGNYEIVIPAKVSPKREIPSDIPTPCYAKTTIPLAAPITPEIKNEEQIQGMRESCKLARKVLDSVNDVIKVGMTTDELDVFMHNLIISQGAYPSPLNYRGFPKSVCTSVNNVICHGIPDSRPLLEGDIINVDVTVFYKGFHGDCSAMFFVGEVDRKGKQLVRGTLEALNAGIRMCWPGQKFSEIGHAIEKVAKKNKLKVVPDYAGHGIGSYFHGPPDIFHYSNTEEGRMFPGMTFTIEPILTQGSPSMKILSDKWTSVTLDGSRTAQWEHTVLITKTGVQLLTGPDYILPEER